MRWIVVGLLCVLSLAARADESWTVVQVGGTVLDGVQHPFLSQGGHAQRTLSGTVGNARVTFDIARVKTIEILDSGHTADVQFRDGTRTRVRLEPPIGSLTGQWQGGTMVLDISHVRRFGVSRQGGREAPPIRS